MWPPFGFVCSADITSFIQARLNFSLFGYALALISFQFFEHAEEKDQCEVEDDGSAERVEDQGDEGAVVGLFVDLLHQLDEGL